MLAKVKIEGIGERLAMVEAKMVLDILAGLLVEADVETLRDMLVRIDAQEEAGQTTRAQPSRAVEKIEKHGETVA